MRNLALYRGTTALVIVGFICLCVMQFPGCGPVTMSFTLGAEPPELKETVVIEDDGGGGGAKIAMIDVRGLIVDEPRPGFLSAGTNPVDDLVARLEKAGRDSEVRAVVVRINSPGGSVSASDTMYSEVRRFRQRTGKPVVMSLGEVAASGGYYLALAGDRIVTQPTTITGSIGVIMPTINVSNGLSRIGIVSRSVTSGVNKDMANPLEPMREGQYAILQTMVNEYYGRFRGLVVERRSHPEGGHALDASRLDELTDGRIVSGAQAVNAGLADSEGGVREAMEQAKSLAGLQRARLVKYHGEGQSPKSPYAAAEARASGREGGESGGDFNLLKLEAGAGGAGLGMLSPGNAYYVWWAGGGG